MKKLVFIFGLCSGFAFSQGQNITSWNYNKTGHQSQYYSADGVTVNNLNDSSEIQEICYNTDSLYIRTNILANFIIGPWPGDPFLADGQNNSYVFPRNPTYPSSTHQTKPTGIQGLLINGVALYDDGDGKSYKTSTGTNANNGDGDWDQIAWVAHADEMDSGNGHPDPNKVYHNHSNPVQLCDVYTGTEHSPIIGWSFDGWPIYGPFGYSSAMDNTSAIERMTSSWSLRNITTRTVLYDGTDVTDGPAVSATFPLGIYIQDYGYTANSGDLDYYNGRYCVTPEYPSGTYAYFLNTDASGNASYPNMIGPKYYGTVYLTNFGGTSGAASKMKVGVTCYEPVTPTVSLSVGSSTVYETSGSTTVTATLSEATNRDVTVSLSLSGTASSSSDYSLATSIVVPQGSTSASITLSSTSDSNDESNESIIIDISAVDEGTESGTQQQTITLYDDDTQITASYCGTTLAALSSSLYSDAVTNATYYRYLIEHSASGYSAVSTRGSSDNLFRLSWVSTIKYGTTYTVKVAAYVNGSWQDYGSACSITTPLTQLQSAYCGSMLSTTADALYANEVTSATNYRYLIENSSTGFSAVSTRGSSSNLFRLSWVSGVKYGTTYTIKVAAYVDGSWSSYGSSCTVTTPATSLQTAYCGITETSTADALYCYEVDGATDYRYQVVNSGLGYSKVSVRGSSSNLFRLSWMSGIISGTTYTIKVAAYVNGAWQSYGSACTVTTPSSGLVQQENTTQEKNEELISLTTNEVELETYPNPNNGNFTLRATEAGTFTISNELGQVIRKIELNEENQFRSEISDLPQGAYFVSAWIQNKLVTNKVMVILK